MAFQQGILLLLSVISFVESKSPVTSCGKNYCEKSGAYPISSTFGKSLENDPRFMYLKDAPPMKNSSKMSEDDSDIPPEFDSSTQICQSTTEVIFPQEAQNTRGQRRFIINFGPFTQGITIERCLSESLRLSCAFVGLPSGYQSVCVQKEMEHRLTTIDNDPASGQVQTGVDIFRFPSYCACKLVKGSLPPAPLANCPQWAISSPLVQVPPPESAYVPQYSAASVYADEGAKNSPTIEPRSFAGPTQQQPQWPANFVSRSRDLFGSSTARQPGFSDHSFFR